jgi:hypothetical protein
MGYFCRKNNKYFMVFGKRFVTVFLGFKTTLFRTINNADDDKASIIFISKLLK